MDALALGSGGDYVMINGYPIIARSIGSLAINPSLDYSIDLTEWLALVEGDSLTSASVEIDGTALIEDDTDHTPSHGYAGNFVYVWLKNEIPPDGPVVGDFILVTFIFATLLKRSDERTIAISIVAR